MARKILAILSVAFLLTAYANGYQSDKEKAAQATKHPPQTASTAVAPKQPNGSDLEAKQSENAQRQQPVQVVVQTPPQQKDFYDKAPLWVNVVLALVGIFGLVAAFKTLRKFERQTVASEKASVAAESAAKTAAKDLSISSRAWVDARVGESTFEVGKPLAVKIVFENSGKTPALKARTLQVAKLINKTPEEITLTYPETNLSPGFSIIMPGGDLTRIGNCLARDNDPPLGMGGILTQQMADKILKGEFAAVTYGRIEYEDVFGIKHWTLFFFFLRVFEATQKMPEIRGWGCAPTGNEMDSN